MAMTGPSSQQDWWARILGGLRFGARIPAAVLIITAVGMLSFVAFFVLFRATGWLWSHFLRAPW